jgi:hypothetical protein
MPFRNSRQAAPACDLKTALRTCPAMRFSNGFEDGHASTVCVTKA